MIEVRVPDEQEGTKAVVRAWLKQVGDAVAVNDPLVELEDLVDGEDVARLELPEDLRVLDADLLQVAEGGGAGLLEDAELRLGEPVGRPCPRSCGGRPCRAPPRSRSPGWSHPPR